MVFFEREGRRQGNITCFKKMKIRPSDATHKSPGISRMNRIIFIFLDRPRAKHKSNVPKRRSNYFVDVIIIVIVVVVVTKSSQVIMKGKRLGHKKILLKRTTFHLISSVGFSCVKKNKYSCNKNGKWVVNKFLNWRMNVLKIFRANKAKEQMLIVWAKYLLHLLG